MKCVKVDGKIIRVSDEEGQKLVSQGKGEFSPKKDFKAQESGE